MMRAGVEMILDRWSWGYVAVVDGEMGDGDGGAGAEVYAGPLVLVEMENGRDGSVVWSRGGDGVDSVDYGQGPLPLGCGDGPLGSVVWPPSRWSRPLPLFLFPFLSC